MATARDWFTEDGSNFRMTGAANVWTDITVPFWSMPENTDHPTQKPEKLTAKLVLASSNENDMVFDPFLGSGTTAVVAKKFGRRFLGIEQEQKYCAYAIKRLALAQHYTSIQGYDNAVFLERNAGISTRKPNQTSQNLNNEPQQMSFGI